MPASPDATSTSSPSGGVFSPEHLDQGTRVLLDEVPAPPASGHLLDLGAGWGPIAISLALQSPDATVWAVDVNERALALVRRNCAKLGISNVNAVLPADVPGDLRFATIWSNPPIRVGKQELHAMLEQWLPRLDDDATAWLVVAKHLGAESLQRWIAECPRPRGRASGELQGLPRARPRGRAAARGLRSRLRRG